MDIAFAFDENYVDHAQVAIESILDCHDHRDDITFWLATTSKVQAERASSLDRQISGRARFEFLTSDDGFRSLPVTQLELCSYISTGMYLRLFLPGLVPQHMQRLLYLDCDVLVNGDLGPLWDLPLGDAPLAAVRDGTNRSAGERGGIPGAGPHIKATAPYFNSGVLLMNLPVWRRTKVTEQCLEYLHEYEDRLRFPDQDALNLVTYGQWLRLERKWNDTVLWWVRPDEPTSDGHIRVSHFVGPVKPWHSGFSFAGSRDRYRELAARIPLGAMATPSSTR